MADPSAVRPPRPIRWLLALPGGGTLAGSIVSRRLSRPPRRRIETTPDAYGWDWHPITLRTSDRVTLRGWCLEPPHPVGTVALFHGLKHCREQTLSRSALLATAGYRCVAIDHRAHGDSGGSDASFGWHERHDVSAVAEHIGRRWPGFRAGLGLSQGAAALVYAGQAACGWDALILESLYDDVLAVFDRRVAAGQYPAWFGGLVNRLGWVTEWRLGIRYENLRPGDHLHRLAEVPTLFVSGEKDITIPAGPAEKLAQVHPGRAGFWLVPGAAHRDVFEVGGEEYRRRVVGWLEQARAAHGDRSTGHAERSAA